RFWLQPTAASFEKFGLWLGYDHPQNAFADHPARPAFEAMKRRLADGLMPEFDEVVRRLPVDTMASAQAQPDPVFGPWWWGETLEVLRRNFGPEQLPPAAPSLFRAHADVLLLPEAQADAVAALFSTPSAVEF